MKNGKKRTCRNIRKWKLLFSALALSAGLLSGCVHKEDAGEELEELATESEKAEEGEAKEPQEKSEAEQTVYVYVCGAVNAPGVYELKGDARVYEALELAGGMTGEADPEWINQAEPVTDGERIYVPTREETEASAVSGSGQWTDASGGGQEAADGKVNINTAGKEELMTLSGIGEAKAQSIVKYREEHGSFQNIEELKQIEGIKDGVFNKIKDDITV